MRVGARESVHLSLHGYFLTLQATLKKDTVSTELTKVHSFPLSESKKGNRRGVTNHIRLRGSTVIRWSCDGPTADRLPTLTHEAQGCWSPGMGVSARGRAAKSEGNVLTPMATGFCGPFSKGICCETQRMHQGTEKPPERVCRENCVPWKTMLKF